MFKAFVITLSSLFDDDKRSISMNSLPGINTHPLYPVLWEGRRLYRFRSKAVAHRDKENESVDFASETGLTYNEVRSILNGSCELFDSFA